MERGEEEEEEDDDGDDGDIDEDDVESLFGETVDDLIDHAKKAKSKEEYKKSFDVPASNDNATDTTHKVCVSTKW